MRKLLIPGVVAIAALAGLTVLDRVMTATGMPRVEATTQATEPEAAAASSEHRPLSDFVREAERLYDAHVIEAEMEQRDGRRVAELKMLPPRGRTFTIELDAITAEIVRARGNAEEFRR
ncbi:PepSY domain-containing protein [Roseococcus pinisoli]|uniref:PepSY domain-containing protein n=1 Tax=Roseococcus pinisoli TaxID=2835040 RepID=A0ABS5Q7C4_9PROT|nr:hypothetical protein [Roseococcus pinisoli]MBS7809550.1 PepSY domain-containing protein [Roseococcus pinisoli]